MYKLSVVIVAMFLSTAVFADQSFERHEQQIKQEFRHDKREVKRHYHRSKRWTKRHYHSAKQRLVRKDEFPNDLTNSAHDRYKP